MDKLSKSDLVALDSMGSGELRTLLETQNLSLKPNELDKVRVLLGRNPTLVELHIFNTMWSEHCSYKSSSAVLKKYLPTKAAHVVLGPGEDAGIVRFCQVDGKSYCLVLAHESHNHPSQVLPVEGAATGIGGIVRDVYCMGADVLGVLDPLRFGDPDGPNGPRASDIAYGVVDGIAQYANALGVPNLGGDTMFDSSYDDNCLVNVVALGIVEEGNIIRSRVPAEATEASFDLILFGKPTDASGFGGAAFASERLSSDDAAESQGAVQVPDPFLKRVLTESTKVVLSLVRERGWPIGFKDLGAGGISCAFSEIAAAAGVGAFVDLDRVNTASPNMRSEVIACSETQERYALAVPSSATEEILRVFNEGFDIPNLYTGAGAFVVGRTTNDKRFTLIHGGKVVCESDVDAITTGISYDREAKPWTRKRSIPVSEKQEPDLKAMLLHLLASDNVASKSMIYRHYDTEVQGSSVLRPGEADASVRVFIPGQPLGLAAAIGGNSRLAALDPYLGGMWAVCEAVRNVVCVGGRPLAITDCLNYGDPEDPGVFWEFKEGVKGIGEACKHLGFSDDRSEPLPVVSGNVSFYNQSEAGNPIAPTPIVACAGKVSDIRSSRGLGFKEKGSKVIFIGCLHTHLGGSEFERHYGTDNAAVPPAPDFKEERAALTSLLAGFEGNLILAAHDVSQGGILVTLSEMAAGSGERTIGCSVEFGEGICDISAPPSHFLFSEYCGVVVEIAPAEWEAFHTILKDNNASWHELGETNEGGDLNIQLPTETLRISCSEMTHALEGNLRRIFGIGG